MYPLCQMLGIPAVSLGVGNEDSRNHAPNENIHLRDFWLGIEHIGAIMHRFGEQAVAALGKQAAAAPGRNPNHPLPEGGACG